MATERLREIEEIAFEYENNKISNLLVKYKTELEEYKWIDSVEEFSVLRLANPVKYIYKKKCRIRSGILVKIVEENNRWFAIVKKMGNLFEKFDFESVYFFYGLNNNEKFRKYITLFLPYEQKN